METLIRPWRRGDFPAVRRILWESWIAAYKPFIPEEDLRAYFTATYHQDALARLYDNPRVHGFIAEADGEAVGFSRTQFHLSENRLYLASLYLLPPFQGKGIGGELLRAAEANARGYGLSELWVGVMVKNEAAGRWYGRRGFRFVREEPFRMGRTTVVHVIGSKSVGEAVGEAGLRRLAAVYPGEGNSPPLAESAAALLAEQKEQWPGLAAAYTALQNVRVREVRSGSWAVQVQFNPRRSVSSGARVDPESIRRRPCFLCRENLPGEQRAILYRETYLILCNPVPVFPGHLTVAHIRHLPQSLADHREVFLRLALDFGPQTVLLYNGPRCGASAPDHLHFQAVPAGLPVERELRAAAGGAEEKRRGTAVIWAAEGIGRGAVVVEGKAAGDTAAALGEVIAALGRTAAPDAEPMMNVLATHSGEGWRLMIFPRLKHRPDAYFREGEGKLSVSPGAVEMGGVFVTHREEDFLALDAGLIEGILREVAFDDGAVKALVASL
ncbi:MAG: GNAT family N-acetyltransferase [Syntrophales bacterium]